MTSKQSFISNYEENGGGEMIMSRASTNTGAVVSNVHSPVSDLAGLSQLEIAILRSTVPIDINETEEITVNGQRGIWANRSEVANWRGPLPIEKYEINSDASPEVITKRSHQQLVYQQEVAIRYLRPPTPPAPGDILIQQEVNTLTPPAPPLVIRQQPPRPVTPQPLVIREAPPPPPPQVGRKVITISGKKLPPPPRKVVIERLPPIPTKPQSVIIERWLPYNQVKRRVIFQKANEHCDPVVVPPKNVIIQWDAPQVQVKKEFKDLGVIRANPAEYVARYGTTLKNARELPSFVLEIKPPSGVVLAADSDYSGLYELEGDLQALKLVDLDREGLSEYKAILKKLGILGGGENGPEVLRAVGGSSRPASVTRPSESGRNSTSATPRPATDQTSEQIVVTLNPQLIAEIFNQIDRDHNGRLSVDEAQRILVKLNSRLGKSSDELELRKFFEGVGVNQDGSITVSEFKKAFESQ